MNGLTLYIGSGRTLTAFCAVEAISEDAFSQLLASDRARFNNIAERYGALDRAIADARNPQPPQVEREFADELTTPEAEAGMAAAIYSQQ